jgi:acetoin utilization deacetylase AcuC-like enzyme
MDAIGDFLLGTGLMDHILAFDAPVADRDALLRVHDAGYLDLVEHEAPVSGLVHLDPDTAMSPGTYKAALRAAGAGVKAVELIMEGVAENAFCNVRPPGHHACHDRAMGFCFFNNIAVAAAAAMDVFGIERVVIADFDVHHGNGTEDIFELDERVLMVSTFQHPYYPYSGDNPANERMVNVPLAAYSRADAFRAAVSEHWIPAIERFQPEMFFISAGFDAHREDDMGMLQLADADYAWVTTQLMATAKQYAAGRIVSMLEGGYNLEALARSAAAHVRVLAGLDT